MNGRIHAEETPEGRLAAVARMLVLKVEHKYRKTKVGAQEPDYADFREAFAPYIRRELLLARIDESRETAGLALTGRMKELAAELLECEKLISREERL